MSGLGVGGHRGDLRLPGQHFLGLDDVVVAAHGIHDCEGTENRDGPDGGCDDDAATGLHQTAGSVEIDTDVAGGGVDFEGFLTVKGNEVRQVAAAIVLRVHSSIL